MPPPEEEQYIKRQAPPQYPANHEHGEERRNLHRSQLRRSRLSSVQSVLQEAHQEPPLADFDHPIQTTPPPPTTPCSIYWIDSLCISTRKRGLAICRIFWHLSALRLGSRQEGNVVNFGGRGLSDPLTSAPLVGVGVMQQNSS